LDRTFKQETLFYSILMENPQLYWIGFNVFVLIMLALDLGVFNRKSHEVSVKEALIWSAVWIGMALLFNVFVYFNMGKEKALEFLTGYLLEKSLSVDNIFVFVIVFTMFGIPAMYQHKILFWGIFGAIVMRIILIFSGIALIAKFHWLVYVFGGFLVITGIKMVFGKEKKSDPSNNIGVRIFRKLFPVKDEIEDGKFFVKENGRTHATRLFLTLIVIEVTDLVFAIDSIPAILAITNDAFIVYTSNLFAILGLRSLYFALAGIIHRFKYLKHGLSIVLVFVGIKMIVSEFYKIPVVISLLVIVTVLTVSIVVSLLPDKKEPVSGH